MMEGIGNAVKPACSFGGNVPDTEVDWMKGNTNKTACKMEVCRIKGHVPAMFILFAGIVLLPVMLGMTKIAAFSVSASQGAEATASVSKTLRVAYIETPGLNSVDSEGTPSGLVPDYLHEIAKYTNWQYEYIPISATNLFEELEASNFDLIGGMFYNAAFEPYFSYPESSIGCSNAVLYANKDDSSLKSYNLESLNGKTIGVYENAEDKIKKLQKFLETENIVCTLKYYSYDEMIDGSLYAYLENGSVDMLLGNDLEQASLFKVVASFKTQPYYIVAAPGKDAVLAELNDALEKIADSTPDFAEKHYEANFPNILVRDVQLNEAERAYIESHTTITVAAVENWHPLFYNDKEDTYPNGLVSELLALISAKTGLGFIYVYAPSYAEAIALVQEGKADILGFYIEEEKEAEEKGLVLSKAYITMNNIVLRNKFVDFPKEGLTGAVLTGRIMPDIFRCGEVQYYTDMQDAIQAVDRGDIDFAYGLAVNLEWELQNRYFRNVNRVMLVNHNNKAAIAVARPASPQLLTILNKGIGSLTTEEKDMILSRNLMSFRSSETKLSDFIYANPIECILVLAILLLLITTVVIVIARLKVKDTFMKGELKRAEAESKAKGDFLSKMSHEIRTPMNVIVGLSDLTCQMSGVPEGVEENCQKIRSSSQYLLSLISDILDMSRIENDAMVIAEEKFSMGSMLREIESMMQVQAEQKRLTFLTSYEIRHDLLVGDVVRLRQVIVNLLSNALKFTPVCGMVWLTVTEEVEEEGRTRYLFSVKDTGIGIAAENRQKIFKAFEQVHSDMSKNEGTGLGLSISSHIVKLMGGELSVRSKEKEGSEFYFTLLLPLREDTRGETVCCPVLTAGGNTKLGQDICVLLAEDNTLNAEIVDDFLKLWGIRSEWALDGQQAVDMFLAGTPGQYQLVLMDIQMPVKNGLEVAREIRSSGRSDSRIPIIAMTANVFKEDVQAAEEAGMSGFVSKPVDFEYLREVIEQQLKMWQSVM